MHFHWLTLFLTIMMGILVRPSKGNREKELVDELLKEGLRFVRPVVKSSDTLGVNFSLTFIGSVINDKDHTLTMMTYENLFWSNPILKWEPDSYEGIKNFVLDKDYLWTPDITLYDPITDVDVQYGQGDAVIRHDGDVLLIRTSKVKVLCDFYSRQFPFDVVECSLKYGSWVYDDYKLNLSLSDVNMDFSLYQENPTWKLETSNVEKKTMYYPCCPEPYSSITYKIKYTRQDRHFVHVLLTPAFLLSLLTILLFLLPSYNSDRMILGVLLFCAFFILLLYTSSLVPDWNTIPCFVVFLIVNLVLIAISTFLNSLIVQMANSKDGHEVPKIIRTIMLKCLARLFCMNSIVKRHQGRHLATSGDASKSQSDDCYKLSNSTEKLPLASPSAEDGIEPSSGSPNVPKDGKQSFEADVAFIRAFIRRCWQKAKMADENENLRSEWRDVANVANRLFFLIYLTIILIGIGAVHAGITP